MLSVLLAAAAAAATPAAITLKDPDIFVRQLTEMGYAPDTIDKQGETVTMVAHLAKSGLVVVLGGCTASKECTYVVLLGTFTDANSATPEWIAKMNGNYDLIKVWKNDAGRLTYSSSAVAEQMSRASFRKWIELVDQSSEDLGQEAVKAGFTK
jgi:ankyrin repeat protein